MKTSTFLYFKRSVLIFCILIFLVSCSVYKQPTDLNTAASSNEKGMLKITMVNGDEFIYESVVKEGDYFYGINSKTGVANKTLLAPNEIAKVERQNKGASGFMNVFGIGLGIGSIVLAILMLG